jgi:hypothetical protein
MIFRVYPNQDTYITNEQRLYVPQTASNFGASEIMKVYKLVGTSGALPPVNQPTFAHAIVQFDLTSIAQLTASNKAPTAGACFRLHLFDARTTGSLPNGYSMEVQALAQPWSEGQGYDTVLDSDLGAANWVQATTSTYWTTPGASGTMPIPFYFQTGLEDLDVDVTQIVNAWLTGGLQNNGFLIALSSTLEADSNNYYLKEFFSRQTFLDYSTYMPYLEMRWDDHTQDDRNDFIFDNSGTLVLYNEIRGALVNLPGSPQNVYLQIQDMTGTLFTVTGSATGLPGVYSASFAILTGSYSGSVFSDIWSSTLPYLTSSISGSVTSSFWAGAGQVYMTGNFYPQDQFAMPVVYPELYTVSMPQLKKQYEQAEVPRMSLFVQPKDYNPAVVLTASFGAQGIVVNRAYYRIRNDRTGEDVVPFGTGSYQGGVDVTRLSYDQRGDFFRFYMSSLPRGQVYRITYLFDVDGQLTLVDEGFKFRVV